MIIRIIDESCGLIQVSIADDVSVGEPVLFDGKEIACNAIRASLLEL